MPLPLLADLAATLAPTVYKGIKGIIQGNEADNLKKRDTTPPAFYEALGLTRQQAAAFGMPGASTQLNRIEAGTNDALSAATRAGTSSSSIMGLLEKADANRQQALANLGTREDAYHEQKNRQLTGMLDQQAKYQDRDQQEFDRNKAALEEASSRNLYGAVDSGSQIAAYFLNKGQGKDTDTDDTSLPLSVPVKPKRLSYNRFGVYDPTGIYS